MKYGTIATIVIVTILIVVFFVQRKIKDDRELEKIIYSNKNKTENDTELDEKKLPDWASSMYHPRGFCQLNQIIGKGILELFMVDRY